MPHDSKPTPLRVLIVDNEEQIVELYKEFMEVWGYSAVIAEGIGSDLLEDAREKAREFRCQMALVDMRLVDNFDEDDTSGLNLIEEIKPAETIIVSGYGTLDLALETVKNRGAADFFEKSDDPDKLKIKMDKVSKKICDSRKIINVGPPEVLSLTAKTLFDPSISIEHHDQLLDLLVGLFPNAGSLRLEKEDTPHSLSMLKSNSLILKVYEDDSPQPVYVKLGKTLNIQKEVHNYEKYIKGVIVGNDDTLMRRYMLLWDIAGIVYSYSPIKEINFRKL